MTLRRRVSALGLAASLALAACQYLPDFPRRGSAGEAAPASPPATPSTATAPTPQPLSIAPELPKTCDALGARNWTATRIAAAPGGAAQIEVSGEVDVRTAGFRFAWFEGPTDRSATPTLRLILVPQAPAGMAAQVVTTERVNHRVPDVASGYRGVVIGCGSIVLGEVRQISGP